MTSGRIIEIYVASEKCGPMTAVEQANAVSGQGLEGDRYGEGRGSFTKPGSVDRQVTLIEVEAIEGARREYEIEFTNGDTRRNLVTQHVPLNHLVGQTFQVGQVTLRGIRLCEPCGHLEELTCAGIKKSLVHRGGLRAEVLDGGPLKVGDPVRWDA